MSADGGEGARPEAAGAHHRVGERRRRSAAAWASVRCRRCKKLLEKTGLSLDDFDLVELNEAFAAQVLAVLKDLPIPMEKLNVNGGAIALGHPIGCTGTRIVVTLLYEMMRRKARRGLATLCVSGGMGMAMGIELCETPASRRVHEGRDEHEAIEAAFGLVPFVTLENRGT